MTKLDVEWWIGTTGFSRNDGGSAINLQVVRHADLMQILS